jgi:DNA polymerase
MVGSENNEHALAMLIGEAPGQDEEESGFPFVGKSGRELSMYLQDFARIPRNRFHITNLCRCRPPKNRDPHKTEIDICSSHLLVELDEVRPRIIGTIGRLSTQWFLEQRIPMEKVHGMVFEHDDRVIVPLYHPAAGLHSPRRMKEIIEDFKILGEVIRGERGMTQVPGIVPEYAHRNAYDIDSTIV